METKIIFLDHDGVMVTDRDFAISRNNRFDITPFSRRCVEVLNEIIIDTDADIVVSSDWIHRFSFSEMCDLYRLNGVCKKPIGFTQDSPKYKADTLGEGRSEEIMWWTKLHRIRRWVAIDDMNMWPWLGDHFVHCRRFNEGLGQKDVKEEVLAALTIEQEWPNGYIRK